MNRQYDLQIGGSLGKVLEVDVYTDDTGWGRFLRIRIELKITKSLAQGKYIIIQGEKLWIPIKYEKLPKVSFKCRKIIHLTQCNEVLDLNGTK